MYPILKTKRTIVKPYSEQEYENIFNLLYIHRDENEGSFVDMKTADDAAKIIHESIKPGIFWIILCKETQSPIGWILCDKALGHKINKRIFIHTWIRDAYRHMGLGREILEKVMNFAFYGINTEVVVTNVKNSEMKAHELMKEFGFTVYNHFPKNKAILPRAGRTFSRMERQS